MPLDPRRATVLPPQPPGRGPNGRPFCRRCGAEVPKARLCWCSDACVQAYLVTTWSGARAAVARRDSGVCALCRVDTEAQRAAFRAWYLGRLTEAKRPHVEWGRWRYCLPIAVKHQAVEWLAFHGVPLARAEGPRWYDVDHIRPVADGGTNALENLRTLCIRCHQRHTAEWRRSRSTRHAAMPLFAEVPR